MSSTAPEEDKKPDHINLKVCGQGSDGDIFFKIKKTTPFAKLFAAYCEKTGKSVNSIRFMFDGERLLPTDTPEKHGMENDDTIDAVAEQQGGNSLLNVFATNKVL